MVSLKIGLLVSHGSLHDMRELRQHPGTFTASNLPPGLTIGAKRGRIHGRIAAHSRGAYVVEVTLTHDAEQVHATFTWTVTKKNHPPRVTHVPSQGPRERVDLAAGPRG